MLWMAVTPDEYELPMAVADTAKELSHMLGLKSNTVKHLYYKHNKGEYKKHVKYKIVKIKEETKRMDNTITKDCTRCFYYGRPSDAPETADEECMYISTEDEDYTPPCERGIKEGD